jgi:hypothetical protein
MPSFSSGSLQELAGNSHSLQELAGKRDALQQQWQQQEQQGWHVSAARGNLQQQQQQQQAVRRFGFLHWLISLMWSFAFAPLLPFTWLWAATLGRCTKRGEQQQQQQGLQYAYAQAYQPEAATGPKAAAAVPATRRPRRSIVFEQPSGFGVHERSKRRGLLEVRRVWHPHRE